MSFGPGPDAAALGDEGSSSPPVSVVIAAYNAADVLPGCLRSLEYAAAAGVEIIVVDDGSADDTWQLIGAWRDFPVRTIRQRNAGPSSARNAGLKAASGDRVAFIDSDDSVTPDWHTFMVGATKSVASCAVDLRRESGSSSIRVPASLGPAFRNLEALFLPGAYSVTRDLLLLVGGFDPQAHFGEHHELGLRLAQIVEADDTEATAQPLVVKNHDRGAARATGYAQRRLAATEYGLQRHAELLRRDRKLLADFHSVAGHDALTLGQRRRAARHMAAAVRYRPWRAKMWLRLGKLIG